MSKLTRPILKSSKIYNSQPIFKKFRQSVAVNKAGTYDEFASRLQLLFENFDITEIREEILIPKFIFTVPKAIGTELRI